MIVVVLTAVPAGLRGHLTRWLLEISPGVFVGHISARVRELMWQRIIQFTDNGRALMVYTARNEQRLIFEVHGHTWEPTDFEGICLIRRPTMPDYVLAESSSDRGINPPPEQTVGEPDLGQGTVAWKRRDARKKPNYS